jgi:hypothetical protein
VQPAIIASTASKTIGRMGLWIMWVRDIRTRLMRLDSPARIISGARPFAKGWRRWTGSLQMTFDANTQDPIVGPLQLCYSTAETTPRREHGRLH